MTNDPRRVSGDDWGDLDPAHMADMVVAPDAPQAVPDDAAIVKALVVIRALQAAGLQTKFGFDPDEAKMLWAARLGRFHIDILTEAITDWIAQPGTDFPSVGDVETAADFVMAERRREYDHEKVVNRQECSECDGARYIRVDDADETTYPNPVKGPQTFRGTHMEPCPACPEMVERRALYERGHWDAEHIERGGCPSCWHMHPSLHHRAKAKAGAR